MNSCYLLLHTAFLLNVIHLNVEDVLNSLLCLHYTCLMYDNMHVHVGSKGGE